MKMLKDFSTINRANRDFRNSKHQFRIPHSAIRI
jgi:hypothetical protein